MRTAKHSPRGSENGNRWSPTGHEILTRSGRLIDLTNPDPEQIYMSDIASSLASQERFTGHCPLRPTVAQHSLAVMHIARELWLSCDSASGPRAPSQQLRRAALMHDAAEYLVGDNSGAVKLLMRAELHGAAAKGSAQSRARDSAFDRLETAVHGAIATRFNCDNTGYEEIVHEADLRACEYEMAYSGWCTDAQSPIWVSSVAKACYATRDGGAGAFLLWATKLGMCDDSA